MCYKCNEAVLRMKFVLSRDRLRKLGRDERTPKREETLSSVIALSRSKPETTHAVQITYHSN